MPYLPSNQIDSVLFVNGACLVTHSRQSATLIIRKDDIPHINFLEYQGSQIVERSPGQTAITLRVTPDTKQKIMGL